MNNLRERTAFLLVEHKRVFNQNPSKRSLMGHIKELQVQVDELEKIVKGDAVTTTFETAKVGDKVWSITAGWGEVRKIDYSSDYPLVVYFAEVHEFKTFTVGGLCKMGNLNQSLFWDEAVIDAPANPTPSLAVDAKILVWDVPEVKHKRHFSHFDEYGYIYTFTDGKTSFTSRSTEVSKWVDWDFAE